MMNKLYRWWMQSGTSRSDQARQWAARRLGFDPLEQRAMLSLVGGELHINTYTPDDQDESTVACSSNGNCVVAWSSFVESDFDIRAQIYDANGDPVGSEITVANTLNDEIEPTVAIDSFGFFVVAWREDLPTEGDILAQLFTPEGQPDGDTIFVETSSRFAHEPSVAMDANGAFVVAYTLHDPDRDVIAHMFHNDGSFFRRINVARSFAEEHSANVARADDGRFAIAYQIDSRHGLNSDIRLRRYNARGALLGASVITGTRHRLETNPAVALDNSGSAVVAYEVRIGGDWDIHARRVSNRGRVGPVFAVQDIIGSDELGPSIALDRTTGRFAVSYEYAEGGSTGVEVAEFQANGQRIQTIDLGTNRDFPAISIDGFGFYFVTYTSFDRDDDPEAGIFGHFGEL